MTTALLVLVAVLVLIVVALALAQGEFVRQLNQIREVLDIDESVRSLDVSAASEIDVCAVLGNLVSIAGHPLRGLLVLTSSCSTCHLIAQQARRLPTGLVIALIERQPGDIEQYWDADAARVLEHPMAFIDVNEVVSEELKVRSSPAFLRIEGCKVVQGMTVSSFDQVVGAIDSSDEAA